MVDAVYLNEQATPVVDMRVTTYTAVSCHLLMWRLLRATTTCTCTSTDRTGIIIISFLAMTDEGACCWVGLTGGQLDTKKMSLSFNLISTSVSLIILVCILEQFLVVPVQLGVHDLLVLDPDEALVLGHVRHVGPEHLHTHSCTRRHAPW